MKNEKNTDRLIDAIGNIREEYICDAHSVSAPQKKKVSPRRALIASAAAVLVAVGAVFALPALIRRDHPVTPIDNTDPHIDPYVDPLTVKAPWEDGRLSFTVMTYGSGNTLLSLPQSTGIRFVSMTDESLPELPTSETEPEESVPETVPHSVTVSLAPDTKISSCVNGDYLRIVPGSGEHVDCVDVYYDVKNDKTVCLDCTVLSLIKESDHYFDASVRCLIEDCLITMEAMMAGENEQNYELFYGLLYTDEMKQIVQSGKRPPYSKLESDRIFISEYGKEEIQRKLKKFAYPEVRVIEYGADPDLCLFTLVSPQSGNTYGCYLVRLSDGEIKKLDGTSIGVPSCLNGSITLNAEGLPAANLLGAGKVSVSSDYSVVTVTLPYFIDELKYNDNTGTYIPSYYAKNVILFYPEEGTFDALLGTSIGAGDHPYPAGNAATEHGVTHYLTVSGTHAFYKKGTWCELTGDFVRIIVTAGEQTPVIVMRENGGFAFFDTEGAPIEPSALADKLDPANDYVFDNGVKINLLTGEETVPFPGQADAYAISEDSRFVYAFSASDGIVGCYDLVTGETAVLPVSGAFLTEAGIGEEPIFCLFTDEKGEKLLLAYYKNGTLTFDAEAMTREHPLFISNGIMNEYIEKNIKNTFPYFLCGGKPVRFRNTERITPLILAVCADMIFDNVSMPAPEFFAALAEKLIPYLDYSAGSAWVSEETLDSLLGGQTPDVLKEIFSFSTRNDGFVTISTDTENVVDDYANNLASVMIWYATGYTELPDFDIIAEYYEPIIVDAYREYYRRLNENVPTPDVAGLKERLIPIIKDALSVYEVVDTDRRTGRPYYTPCILCRAGDIVRTITDLYPVCVEIITGRNYAEFVKSGDFLRMNYIESLYLTRTDDTAGNIRIGRDYGADTEKIIPFLSSLDFRPGDKDVRAEAVLAHTWDTGFGYGIIFSEYPNTNVIAVGSDENGRYYAVISGYYAEITKEECEGFKAICRGAGDFDRGAGRERLLQDLIGQYANAENENASF
ncbi:MAG: hypothetical protein MJ070_01530 [Lachnospiraceae bacterium]|nr:hypothetical protein [Lachnospiraceae bacterium]